MYMHFFIFLPRIKGNFIVLTSRHYGTFIDISHPYIVLWLKGLIKFILFYFILYLSNINRNCQICKNLPE